MSKRLFGRTFAKFSVMPSAALGVARSSRFHSVVCVITATTLFVGCVVGPDFSRPALPADAGYVPRTQPTGSDVARSVKMDKATRLDAQTQTQTQTQTKIQEQSVATGAEIASQWWRVFGSTQLSALVEQALRANPTIAAAEAALRVAQENVAAQRGGFLPAVTLGVAPTRQTVAVTLASPAFSGSTYYNLHTAQLNIAYVVDVFGGSRRQLESLQAQVEFQRFQLVAAQLSLSANVVSAALQVALLREQIAITQNSIDLGSQQLPILRKQLELGAIPEASVLSQRALDAQNRALLPPLLKQLAQQVDLLAALT